MKRFFLLLTLFVGSNLFAAWEPQEFALDPNPALDTLAQMAQDKEASLSEILSVHPSFRSDFAKAYALIGRVTLESLIVPANLNFQPQLDPQDSTNATRRISEEIGVFVQALEGFFFDNVKQASANDVQEGQQFKYLYCESHPRVKDGPCADDESGSAFGWTFLRRLMSSAKFIDATCPSLSPFVLWNLNWNKIDDQSLAQYALFHKEMNRLFNFYYNNGKWTHTILGRFDSVLSPALIDNVERRYLDGGPDLMRSLETCMDRMYDQFNSQVPQSTAQASKNINAILKFQSLYLQSSQLKLEVATTDLNADVLYQLSHHLRAGSKRPAEAYQGSSDERYLIIGDFAEFIDGTDSLDIANLFRLTLRLSEIDSTYNYRILTWDELSDMLEHGEGLAQRPLCVASKDYASQGPSDVQFFSYSKEGGLQEIIEHSCDFKEIVLVREKK